MENLKVFYECRAYLLDNKGIHLVNKELDDLIEKENISFTRKQFCKAVLILSRNSHQKGDHIHFLEKYWSNAVTSSEIYRACWNYMGTKQNRLDEMNSNVLSKKVAHKFDVIELLNNHGVEANGKMSILKVIESKYCDIKSPLDFVREIVNMHWLNQSIELSNIKFMQGLYNVLENRLYQAELDDRNEVANVLPILMYRSARVDNNGITLDSAALNNAINKDINDYQKRQFVKAICLLAEIETLKQYTSFLDKYKEKYININVASFINYMVSLEYEEDIDKLLNESAESESSCKDMAKVFKVLGVKDSIEDIVEVLASASNSVFDCGIIVYRLIAEFSTGNSFYLSNGTFIIDFYNKLKDNN